ncbi:unnamed protein product [Phytophthora lilii]|uniref:Unnamed protein product n=1 Tax=Phytophthora lilii TaxID=2077276 RepID=A0A9W6U776_9STRA|nr:unnamed protein product [Phytophthora lilii]
MDSNRVLKGEEFTDVANGQDEERLFGLDSLVQKFTFWRMSRKAAKEIKTSDKKIAGWIKDKQTPESLEIKLGLKALGNRAPESKDYPMWVKYSKLYKEAQIRAKAAAAAAAKASQKSGKELAKDAAKFRAGLRTREHQHPLKLSWVSRN